MESSSDEWRSIDELKPGKPVCDGQPSFDTVPVRWEPPKRTVKSPLLYELFYKDCTKGDTSEWTHCARTSQPVMKVENLPSCSTFVFKVRVENGEDKIFTSEQSDEIKTVQSAACQMLQKSIPVDKKDAKISVRRLPFREVSSYRNEKARIRKFELGVESKLTVIEKTLVIVGATGAGKSTLIDSMVNYILGISWSDPFRFTVENLELDEMEVAAEQAKSQTKWITCYTIHQMTGTRIKYKITIIDTPGYGHTDGNSADVEITNQIRELFTAEGEKGIHSVCFVIESSKNKLDPRSEYIFKAVLSVFGKDILENICIMLTFADDKPTAIELLKAIDLLHEKHENSKEHNESEKHKSSEEHEKHENSKEHKKSEEHKNSKEHEKYFCFNNCAIFDDNKNEGSLLYWKKNLEGYGKFFDAVEKLESVSLLQTNEVLILRNRLQITIANILDKLVVELQLEKSLEKEILLMEKSAKEVEKNKDFTYKTEEKFCSKVPSESYNLNCSICKNTCHKKCWTFNVDIIIRLCEVFKNGNCTQCELNCGASSHRNEKELYEEKTREVTRTYTEKKEKYDIAYQKKLSHGELIAKMRQDMDEHDKYIEKMFSKIVRSVQKLQRIAIRNDPLTFEDYFEMLVKEQMSGEPFAFQKILDLKKKLNEKAERSSLTGKLRQALNTCGSGIREFMFNKLW